RVSEREEEEQKFDDQLRSNLRIVTTACESIYHFILNKKINAKCVKLRIDSLTQYNAIVLVSKDDYISERFADIYKEALKIRNEIRANNIHLMFNFIPLTKNLSEDLITLDGYDLTYAKKGS